MKKSIIILSFLIGLFAPTSYQTVIVDVLPILFTVLLVPLYAFLDKRAT